MLKKIFLLLALLLVALLTVIYLQPADFRVERTLQLTAPKEKLFEYVNDQRKFNLWNPWLKLDPNCKVDYEGPATGVGSKSSWKGDSNVGAGISTISESKPNELVRFHMDWLEPMTGTSTVDFIFKPQGDKTAVTWAMYGQNDFMGKAISLIMSCEDICGTQFEKGLAALDTAAASTATTP